MTESKEIHYHFHYYPGYSPYTPRYTGPWWGIYPPTYIPGDPNWVYNPTYTTSGTGDRLQKTNMKTQES